MSGRELDGAEFQALLAKLEAGRLAEGVSLDARESNFVLTVLVSVLQGVSDARNGPRQPN